MDPLTEGRQGRGEKVMGPINKRRFSESVVDYLKTDPSESVVDFLNLCLSFFKPVSSG